MSSEDDRRDSAERRQSPDREGAEDRRSGANRRTEPRTKKRLRCDITADGVSQRGFVLDVSPKGLFVQTPKPIDPGQEVEIELTPHGSTKIEVRAKVARSRRVPANLASVAQPGVGLRITLASPEWYEFVAGLTEPLVPDKSAKKEPAASEEEPPAAKPKRKRKLPPRMAPPQTRSRYRVQAKHTGGPRSRSLIVSATSREDAEVQAVEQLGSDWKIIDVEGA